MNSISIKLSRIKTGTRLYICNDTALKAVASSLFTANRDFNSPITDNPSECVIGVRIYPFNIYKASNSTYSCGSSYFQSTKIVQLGKSTVNLSDDQTAYVNRNQAVIVLDFGEINLPNKYNSFLDFNPYTSVEIYLPYLGIFQLDPTIILGENLHLYYVVDLLTAECTANITIGKRTVFTTTGSIGVEVPLNTSNLQDIRRDNLYASIKATAGYVTAAGSAGSAIVSGISGNVAGAIGSGITATTGAINTYLNSTIDSVSANEKHYTKGSFSSGWTSFSNYQRPFYIIKRPKPLYGENTSKFTEYSYLVGIPSNSVSFLNALKGYVKISGINSSEATSIATGGILDATLEEQTMIINHLYAGVYL